MIGVIVFYLIIAPALHWTNTWYANYMPFFDRNSWDNTQSTYNITRILTPDHTLDVAKYEEYSPIFLSTTFALCYGLSFASISSVVVNTALFHGKDIMQRWRIADETLDDVHSRLMRKYRKIPQWWFMGLLIPCFALTFVVCYVWDTGMTWWAIIIACIIPVIFIVPIGIVQATTNIQIGLNVITEFLVGYMLPGRPTAMMQFKTYGYITMSQGLSFVQDMKLGHYMKIPPRTMFSCQVVGTLWSVLVQVAVYRWAMVNIPNVCTNEAPNNFNCAGIRVFYTASILWGLIGPQRIFSGTGLYTNLQFFWIVGAAVPVAFWLIQRRYPKSIVRYLNAPVIFNGNALIPPATNLNYMAWGITNLVFNRIIRNKWRGWWMRYNYLTSAGLDIGLAICTILIILTINMTNTALPDWWGNNGAYNTVDYEGSSWYTTIGPNETFGPTTW
jgi:OPT family small oligopeptide transporter